MVRLGSHVQPCVEKVWISQSALLSYLFYNLAGLCSPGGVLAKQSRVLADKGRPTIYMKETTPSSTLFPLLIL